MIDYIIIVINLTIKLKTIKYNVNGFEKNQNDAGYIFCIGVYAYTVQLGRYYSHNIIREVVFNGII